MMQKPVQHRPVGPHPEGCVQLRRAGAAGAEELVGVPPDQVLGGPEPLPEGCGRKPPGVLVVLMSDGVAERMARAPDGIC